MRGSIRSEGSKLVSQMVQCCKTHIFDCAEHVSMSLSQSLSPLLHTHTHGHRVVSRNDVPYMINTSHTVWEPIQQTFA